MNNDEFELLRGPGRIARGAAERPSTHRAAPALYRAAGGGVVRRIAISQGRPQALLKVTSFGRGVNKVEKHAHYITRNSKLELETESGEHVSAKPAIRSLIEEWAGEGFAAPEKVDKKRQARDTAHIVLGVPPGEDREQLSKAVREFAADSFDGHRYAWVRHDDTDAPHVHMILHLTNDQGKKPHLSVKQTEAWRGAFAEHCRAYGIEVDASRAWERGRAPRSKTEQIEYRRMREWRALPPEERSKRRAAGYRPHFDKTVKALEAAKKAVSRGGRGLTPVWVAKRRENAARRQSVFYSDAAALEKAAESRTGNSGAALKRQAKVLRDFAANITATKTRQQRLEDQVALRRRSRGGELEAER